MLQQESEESNGGRTVVGIDPCREFLQLAILAPKQETKVNPHISKKLCGLYSEEHSDLKDAESLAKALLLTRDLPKIAITDKQQVLAKLTRTRRKLVKDLNGYLNRLHIALTESYGVVYKKLFKDPVYEKGVEVLRGLSHDQRQRI